MADLSVTLNGIRFPNPVLTAAGPNVLDRRLMLEAAEGGAGGIVAKTFSVRPARDGRPTIRGIGGGGLANAETWSELGPDAFIAELSAAKSDLKKRGLPLIVSVGYKAEDTASLIRMADREVSPDGYEFSTHYTGGSLDPLVDAARAARGATERPVWMKLSPGFPALEELVLRSEPYVDAFVAVNSYGPVLDMDIETGGPRLGSPSGYGWMSGPPLLPIALRIVHIVSAIQKKPVIGVGGIERGEDAVKFFMAGASLVQVCSAAIKKGSSVYGRIAGELSTWLDAHPDRGGLEGIRGLYSARLRASAGEAETGAGMPLGPSAVMNVDSEKCTLCGACLSRCVQGALSRGEKTVLVDGEKCIGCGYCMDFCRYGAMELRGRE
jgi:dihydroorotate dehydrogenase/NAD-dependent dihydropyrimidine dehydrogenase PreA subunit